MANVPNELLWLSVLVSCGAFAYYLANLLIHLRNRRRVEFRSISAAVYFEQWYDYQLENAKARMPGSFVSSIKPGDWKRAFTVLEFTITNHHPVEITVGPFIINGWMFAEKYTKGMYHPERDYRVFDINTRAPSRLDVHSRVPAKGSFGLRVEILEIGSGGVTHRNLIVPIQKAYRIEFRSSVGKYTHTVRMPAPIPSSGMNFQDIYHWSELIGPMEPTSTGGPVPQGIPFSSESFPMRLLIARRFLQAKLSFLAKLKTIKSRVSSAIPGRSRDSRPASAEKLPRFQDRSGK